jgi:hypothetical protein
VLLLCLQRSKVASRASTREDRDLLAAAERILYNECVFCDPGSVDLFTLSDGRQLGNDSLKGQVRYRQTKLFSTGWGKAIWAFMLLVRFRVLNLVSRRVACRRAYEASHSEWISS